MIFFSQFIDLSGYLCLIFVYTYICILISYRSYLFCAIKKYIYIKLEFLSVCFSRLSLTNVAPQRSVTSFEHHRVYPQSGMIPKYTGYLPRMNTFNSLLLILLIAFLERKYHIGQTYGDTSRDLPICSHSFANFGDFIRSKTSMAISTNDA